MAASVIAALDTEQMPTRVGENDHPEFAWSVSESEFTIATLRDRFVQLFFQMVRVSTTNGGRRISRLKELSSKYTSLLRDSHDLLERTRMNALADVFTITDDGDCENAQVKWLPEITQFQRVLHAFLNHTRDCVKGKGERDLAYALLIAKYEYERDRNGGSTGQPCLNLVNTVRFWATGKVTGGIEIGDHQNTYSPPPGSWKDVLGLCHFIRDWCGGTLTPEYNVIIRDLLRVMAIQIHKDTTSENPSLAAKWAPRESSKKQRWLFYRFVRAFTPSLGSPSQTPVRDPKFMSACKTVRMTLSSLNKAIKTLEVNQCGGTWSEIDPKTIPSIALQKQKTALLNLPGKKNKGEGEEEGIRSTDPDRMICAQNIREYTQKAVKGEDGAEIKAQRTSLYDLVRDAVNGRNMTFDQQLLLEEQWRNNGKQVKAGLPPMIPMVDVSGSMTCDKCTPLYYALGLGLRASEKTHPAFRNRILTFSRDPAWVRLNEPPTRSDPDHAGSFIHRIYDLRRAVWGMNTDFFKAMKMILDTLVKNSVPPEDAKNLVLAVFSDMQIDAAKTRSGTPQAMHSRIKDLYAKHGYEPPHVLYWNLRTTDGFPSVTTEKNVTMLSGFSPVLLNVLESKGMSALAEYTPYRMLSEMLESPRFLG